MHPDVRAGFVDFTARFEGFATHFYCDVKGLVTIGYGNLVDPVATAHALDYVNADGSSAAWSDVTRAWMTVKTHQDCRLMGGGAYKSLTSIRATKESIERLCIAKLEAFEAVLKQVFPEWDSWPSEAQTATLSMAWAMGPHFPATWPAWSAACRAQDWTAAAEACVIQDADNPGLRPRNRANVVLFREAASGGVIASNAPLYVAPKPPARDPQEPT